MFCTAVKCWLCSCEMLIMYSWLCSCKEEGWDGCTISLPVKGNSWSKDHWKVQLRKEAPDCYGDALPQVNSIKYFKQLLTTQEFDFSMSETSVGAWRHVVVSCVGNGRQLSNWMQDRVMLRQVGQQLASDPAPLAGRGPGTYCMRMRSFQWIAWNRYTIHKLSVHLWRLQLACPTLEDSGKTEVRLDSSYSSWKKKSEVVDVSLHPLFKYCTKVALARWQRTSKIYQNCAMYCSWPDIPYVIWRNCILKMVYL